MRTSPMSPLRTKEQHISIDFLGLNDMYKASISNFLKPRLVEKPYPHQEEMFRRAVFLKKFAFFAEQRTGKTMTAIGVMDWAVKRDSIKNILIICPTSVIGSWVSQISYYSNLDFKIFTMSGSAKEVKLYQLNWGESEANIVVTNYEATWRKIDEFLYFKPDMLILDESHKVKNGQSNQHKAVYAISKKCRWRLLLSGTPMSNSPVDIFQQYKVMDPTLFGANKSKFIDQYCIMDPRFPRKFLRYKDLEGFAEIYKLGMYRVKLKNVVKDMPKDLNKFYEIDFDDEDRIIYNKMKEDAIVEIEQEKLMGSVTAPIALSKLLRLHEICGGYLPLKGEDSWDEDTNKMVKGKMEYVKVTKAKLLLLSSVLDEWLEEYPDDKVVIFHRYKPELEGITQTLKLKDIKYVTMTSEMSPEERTANINSFQNNPQVKAIVTSSSIGGVGINLAAANTTIFYSTDFSSVNYEQAKARVHNLLKKVPVLHIHLLVRDTVDKYVYKMLERKLNISGMPFNEIFNIIKGVDIENVGEKNDI